MQKKERKQRVRKTPPLLPRLVILFFLLMVLLFMNIDMCSRILNYGSYEKTTATIVAKKTDGFLLLIPMAELSYQYEGTEYKEDKFFILPRKSKNVYRTFPSSVIIFNAEVRSI